MTPEDLQKELDRLWAKVSSTPGHDAPPTASFSVEGATYETTLETISLLKRQHKEQARHWAEMLETKERALQLYKERQQALELEVRRLREKNQGAESRVLSDTAEVKARLEAGAKAWEAERERFERERKALEAILDATRRRLADETAMAAEARRQSEKREQQYLLDLKELQAKAAQYQVESGKAQDKAMLVENNMGEAKNALEKTLAELLQERQVRQETEKERAAALRKVGELEKHFAELSKIWEEERAQWRELWDRERSSWETQRAEIAAWEENLRKERQAWHADLESKEQAQLQFVAKVNETLRESAEVSSRVASVLKLLSSLGAAGLAGKEKAGRLKKPLLILAAAAGLIAVVTPVWNYFQRPRFKPLSTQPLAAQNPTALAYDGARLWVAEFGGEVLSFDPRNSQSPLIRTAVSVPPPYRPTSLAFGGDWMWSLDSAQARVLRHPRAEPERVAASRSSPGPAPTALAHDGEALWSYDAANKALYRHGSDEGQVTTFGVEREVVPTAMAWVGGRLWIFDSKSRAVLVYALKGSALKFKSEHRLGEAVIGAAVLSPGAPKDGRPRELWLLAGPKSDRPGYSLLKYKF